MWGRGAAYGNVNFGNSTSDPGIAFNVQNAGRFQSTLEADGLANLSANAETHSAVTFDIGAFSSTYIAATIGGTAVNITATAVSDPSLKENIRPVTDALVKLMRLNVISYDWNEKYKSRWPGGPTHVPVGLRADNVGATIPEAEEGITDAKLGKIKGINMTALIPYLVGSIQEQQAEIDTLTRPRYGETLVAFAIGAGLMFLFTRKRPRP